ncbi:ORF4 [Fowl aviadenovirus A]|uniref:ORF4 n=1 Tax=Fowl aviadenovirus A TaxID=190061 RepID=A0A286QWU2_9ADEN|nr:ORF4 [Fowl aviadenovirus A]
MVDVEMFGCGGLLVSHLDKFGTERACPRGDGAVFPAVEIGLDQLQVPGRLFDGWNHVLFRSDEDDRFGDRVQHVARDERPQQMRLAGSGGSVDDPDDGLLAHVDGRQLSVLEVATVHLFLGFDFFVGFEKLLINAP